MAAQAAIHANFSSLYVHVSAVRTPIFRSRSRTLAWMAACAAMTLLVTDVRVEAPRS
jgi:hypothetical protein